MGRAADISVRREIPESSMAFPNRCPSSQFGRSDLVAGMVERHPDLLISWGFCRNREQALPTVQQTYNKRSETVPSFMILRRRVPTHAEPWLLTFQQGT